MRNLITGTVYLNTEGMLPLENEVAGYVRKTGNHVLYRVTPVYDGTDLVAAGVAIEAMSVEDGGSGIRFNVFCYNVQPGVIIDYATGMSRASDETGEKSETVSESAPETVVTSPPVVISEETDYVLNTRSLRFHLPSCESVQEMSPANRQEYIGSREDLISQGYTPCRACRP